VRTKIEEITPVKAQAMLDKHLWPFVAEDQHAQRTRRERDIDNYARMMLAGQWATNHQGLAIDDSGLLVDGQHRLLAIVRSGVTIKTLVTRDLPSNGNGSMAGVLAIDTIDRGKVRGVGQQLQMRHGVKDANYFAAMCRTIILLAVDTVKVTPMPVDVGQCLRVQDNYGKELESAMRRKASMTGLRSAVIGGSLAFAMKAGDRTAIEEFAERIADGENLSKGNPALSVRNYLLRHYKEIGGGGHAFRTISRAVLVGAMYAERGDEMKQVKHSEVGYTYYMDKQKRTMMKLLNECGYVIS